MWGLYAGKYKDYDRVRGGKFCMCTALQYPPTGWKTRPQANHERDDFPLDERAAQASAA